MKFLMKMLNFLILINFSIHYITAQNIYEFDDKGFIYVNEPDEMDSQIAELKLMIRSRVISINRMIQDKINIKGKLYKINKKILSNNLVSSDIFELNEQKKSLEKRKSDLISEIKKETNNLNVLCKQL